MVKIKRLLQFSLRMISCATLMPEKKNTKYGEDVRL